ncbi:uncharacterized protein N7506_005396 [Penicillium brevicompactum]|uniref:uncharacterized protein n=1 Tax=Penicillium brevicompactum TaxID=5074 RepID=UPI00254089E8|nr:uncharacterized protein N7506_005396 [Penicillium brevicompactum]KAJ5337374.1 hypothetical protein N7506_005396 [Penicillium brevicompactum]
MAPDKSYARLAKPVLPYTSIPFSYLSSYLAHADTIGDRGLTQIDLRLSIIQEGIQKPRDPIYKGAFLPIHFARDVKHQVFAIYGAEYEKCGGNGVLSSGKAMITTSLALSQESLSWVSTVLQKKSDVMKEAVYEKKSTDTDRKSRSGSFSIRSLLYRYMVPT